ncbi:MAG: T9SS type A sorting domain-containing protein [Bacteroidetes bacterium]|nr:T9SS type A sorting domain-containing protein [Bacteroidota bacterium]
MKRALLSCFLIFAFIMAYAQPGYFPPDKNARNYHIKETKMHPAMMSAPAETIIGQKFLDQSVIGYTWYDAQTVNYGNVMERVFAFPDGTIGATWMNRGETGDPERGAGYNYFDGASWGTYTPHIGPADRMGWPSYSAWGPNGEIMCLYKYIAGEGPILFFKRENKGEGEWVMTELTGPTGTSLVWHSMTTGGENHEYIHLLAMTYDEPYMGQTNALLYYRSSDGAETWDIDGVIIDGLGSDYFESINSLSFDWSNSVGSNIAFTYGFDEYGGRIFKSTNNGDTWDKIDVFEVPYTPFNHPDDSPDIPCGVGSSGIVLDSQGKAHVVFPRMVKLFVQGEVNWYPYTDGLIYWNEDMPVMDTTLISSYTMDYLYEAGNLVGWVTSSEPYEIPSGQPNYANALCAFPQISIDALDNIFISSSIMSPDYSSGTHFYRHIIANASFDAGTSWEGQIDLNTDIIYIFSECAYPQMPAYIEDLVHIVFQEDNLPGTFEWPNEQSAAVNNNIYHVSYPKDFFIGIKENQPGNTILMSEIFPNPARQNINFNLSLDQISELTINIFNPVGQIVKSIQINSFNGNNENVSVNIQDLPAGIYYCTAEAGTNKTTRKFMVY